jgi:hypothetical protein
VTKVGAPQLLFLLGIALLAGYQAIGWFMRGQWTGMPFSVFWFWIGGPYPNGGWQVDQVGDWLDWLFKQPLSLVSVVAGGSLDLDVPKKSNLTGQDSGAGSAFTNQLP